MGRASVMTGGSDSGSATWLRRLPVNSSSQVLRTMVLTWSKLSLVRLYPLNDTNGDLSLWLGKDTVETLEPMSYPVGFSLEISDVSLQYSSRLASTLSCLFMLAWLSFSTALLPRPCSRVPTFSNKSSCSAALYLM